MPKKNQTVHLAEIVRHPGNGIQIPQTLKLDDAIKILIRKRDEENEVRTLHATLPAFPYDGAYALSIALEEVFGFVVSAPNMFGRNDNRDLEIVIDEYGNTAKVPWGRFMVPNVEGVFQTSYTWENKRIVFQLVADMKGVDVPKWDALVARTKQVLEERSIYKGKVLNVKFTDEDGESLAMPDIKFVNVHKAPEPIFAGVLEEKLKYDVLAYIQQADLMRPLNGNTLKRGVLLAGPYGTGKTLTAAWVARCAQENGWTFIYCDHPDDFYNAHLLARAYQPSVIFVEDVENIAGHDRTAEVNKLLNVLDGADSKMFDIMVIFTTNHGEKINRAMFRPGRMDVTLVVEPPDEIAAIRLAKHYAEGRISDEDFTEAGRQLAGKIPATIKEAVARARGRAVVRSGNPTAEVTNDDLVYAAQAIENERTSFTVNDPNDVQRLGTEIGQQVLRRTGALLANHKDNVPLSALSADN